MRILHLVHQYPPEYVGGVEVYTQVLARCQRERGHEVAVFYRRSADGAELEERLSDGVRVWAAGDGPVTPVRRLLATLGSWPLQRSWQRVLDEFAPQIVHVQHLMGLPASLLATLRQRRIPYVVTLHDYWWVCANAQLLTNDTHRICDGPHWAYTNCARCALARLGKPGLWPAAPGLATLLAARNLALGRARSAARSYIAPTRFVAAWHTQHGLPAERIVVVPHGIEMPQGTANRPPGRPPALRVAYLGGLTWQKGVHIALEAVEQCSGDVTLWIAGDESADPAYVARLKGAASGQVRFLGRLSRSELWATLAQVDALLVPSLWYETFSLIAHEAQAAGLPVIASNLGALAEAVRDGRDGLLVPAGDAQAWRAALRRLADEPGLLSYLRSNVRPPLSLAEHVDRIEQLYQQVVDS